MRQFLATWSVLVVVCASGPVLAQTSAGPQPPPLPPAWLDPPRAQPTTPPPVGSPTPTPVPIIDESRVEALGSAAPLPDPASSDGAARLDVPTFGGPVGLLRVSAARTGAPGQLRLGIAAEYFAADSFLIERDQNRRFAGSFTVGYTPVRHLELFAALLGSSNRNRRQCNGDVCVSEPGRTDPEVIRSLGDVVLGGKYARPVAASGALSLGGQAGVRLMSSATGLGFETSATSLFLDALGTFDLARTASALPIALHVDLGYYVDNSGELASDPATPRPSQLVSSFAYGVGKSRVRTAVGAEGRVALGERVALVPFAEFHWEIVTASADQRYRDFLPPACSSGIRAAGQQACADDRSMQWATFGARLQSNTGLALLAAIDLGIASVGFPYGPPIAPYQFVVGLSAPIDLVAGRAPVPPPRTVVVEKTVAQPSPEGRLAGAVRNVRTNAPVGDAIVTVVGRPRARYATDPDGGFLSAPLAPGEVEVEVVAPGFDRMRARATIAADTLSRLEVALTPKIAPAEPALVAETAKVHGRLTTTKGKPLVGAIVRFVGPATLEARTDANGAYALSLPPGTYAAHAEAGTAFAKDIKATFPSGEDRDLSFTLRPRPTTPSVQLTGDKITLRRPIAWKQGPPGAPLELQPASEQLLDEVADLLSRDRSIRTLVVDAHWDDSLDAAKAADVTRKQAQIVVEYLVASGVGPERVEAHGVGGEQPLVPNLGPANRARNRRIELKVVRDSRL